MTEELKNKAEEKTRAEISKIILKINRKEIELTPEEAKKLKDALNELYEVKEEHHYHSYPVYPSRPYWYWNEPYIYCSSGTGAKLEYLENSNTVKCSL